MVSRAYGKSLLGRPGLVRNPNPTLAAYLAGLLGSDLYAVFPLNEGGGTVVNSPQGFVGAYSGVTPGGGVFLDGQPAVSLGGTSGYIDLFSSAFVNNYPGDKGAVGIWCKVSAAADWTDGTVRRPNNWIVDGANSMGMFKNTTNNQMGNFYKAGNVSRGNTSTALGGTLNWFLIGTNYADTNDGDLSELWLNGAQVGSTLTGLGEFAGTFATNNVIVGANDKSNNNVWKGLLAYLFVAKRPLTAAEWLGIYRFPNP